jgi:dienelactone hydrolase
MALAAAALAFRAMPYDPFARGPHPVGVRTAEAHDAARDRRIPVEVWYPAADAHAGEDLSDATRDRYKLLPILPDSLQDAVRDAEPRAGRFPLIVFSHGFAGHRRQSTFLCTHLASHGYAVVAMDHVGNTSLDVFQQLARLQAGGGAPDPAVLLGEVTEYRPSDVSLVIDLALGSDAFGLAGRVDPERIGMAGHSFGGWTTLAAAGRDPRIRAAVPLAPAGGSPAAPGDPLPELLDLDWDRDVPTLFLVAERDTLLPLPGMHALYQRTKSPKRMAVLANADHQHFCDDVERIHEFMRMMVSAAPPALRERVPQLPPIAERCPGEHGYLFTRALALAHLDAHRRELAEAVTFLDAEAAEALARRGVGVEVL